MRFWIYGLFFITIITACQNQPTQIFIEVDGSRQTLITGAETVRDALAEANINLGPLDRVKPDLYVQLESGLTIIITRVREETETQRESIPFERQTVVNEGLAPGETRIAQLGVHGEDEITIRVVYEDGQEISRTEISRLTVIEPAPEVMVIGLQDTLPSLPVAGTISYISNGNAWLIRDKSANHRALTTHGNLDGRVFNLSPNGRQLLYTTELTNEIELPLNEMWLASTTIVGEKPITVGIQGVLQAAWSPVFDQSLLAYSTAQRTPNPPGWQANNDLWLLDLKDPPAKAQEIIAANTEGLYPWWGTTFTWSADGSQVAYSRADQIGVINLASLSSGASSQAQITPLVDFVPLQTFSDWVWLPSLSWSPDGKFIVATIHGPPLASETAEESQVFDLWLISTDGAFAVKVAEQVGMWANPSWGEAGIAFGQALEPLRSVNSRYTIQLIDKDGSNKRQLFPFQSEPGVRLPELVWSPDGTDLLFVYNGNLHLTNHEGGLPQQLSTDGQASHPRWALTLTTPAILSDTLSTAGNTPALTITETITESNPPVITPTPVNNTPSPTTTPQITATTPILTPTMTITP